MDKTRALDIMNSDFKLWEEAETEEHGDGSVTKTLTLPWGIGKVTTKLEGMTDAEKRRAAVGSYGEYIRDLINEQISDEAVTARAKLAAAEAEQRDRENSASVGGELGVRDSAVQETTDAQASEAHSKSLTRPVGLRETLTARRLEIEDEIKFFYERLKQADKELKRLRRDLKSVDAALAVIEDDDEEED